MIHLQLDLQLLIDGLAIGAVYALIALGYTMVYGVLKLINFAHGEVFMAGAYFSWLTAEWLGGWGIPPYIVLILPVAMVACALLGMTIERAAYRPLRQAPRLAALITAIGVSLLLQNLFQMRFTASPRAFPELIQDRALHFSYSFGAGPREFVVFPSQILVAAVTVILMLLLRFIVKRTKFGKAMRAISEDKDAARLMGINVDRVISYTFALGSAMAAAGGLLYAIRYTSIDPLMGVMPGLKAFVAAVVGGIGVVEGAMLGGLLLGLSEVFVGHLSFGTGLNAVSGTNYKDAVAFLILIAVLLLRPSGILGRTEQEKV